MAKPRVFAMMVVANLVSTMVVADYDVIAGYTPLSDVVEHSELDLDMEEIEVGADLQTDAGFLAAWRAYSEGGSSVKTDSTRTIRDFSTSAQEKLTGETLFDMYEDYWGEPDYADLFTSAACNGTGQFADADTAVRAECCTKGAQYQNVWMYVVHELEDAIGDCEIGDLNANDGGPHAWDEAWAFWSGSEEGELGTGEGFMGYALAEQRCEQFGTCTGDDDGSDLTGMSAVNHDLLELYNEGQSKLLGADCGAVEAIKDKIVKLMTVPLLQGLLRYVYLADPDGGNGGDKEAAELWAFSAAVLPQIHACDADVAEVLLTNTAIWSPSAPISDGYIVVKEEIESVYSCMGIKCSQVGGLLIGESTTYYEGFEPCIDSNDGKAVTEVVGGIAIAVVAAVVVGIVGSLCLRRRRRKRKAAAGDDLGGFQGSSTL